MLHVGRLEFALAVVVIGFEVVVVDHVVSTFKINMRLYYFLIFGFFLSESNKYNVVYFRFIKFIPLIFVDPKLIKNI